MPELRKDPVTGRWIIVARERAMRPHDFKPSTTTVKGPANCPFCEGKESSTPPEILAIRPNSTPRNSSGWKVRVVPNKFPALRVEGEIDKRGEGPYDLMSGVGAHEVIIESPKHILTPTKLSDEEMKDVTWVYRERLADLKKDVRLVYGLIFKNVGDVAGASLEHSHSQLIVTPIVPDLVRREMAGAKTFFDYRGRCIFCDIIKEEISIGERIVINDTNFVAFEPFAPRFAFETWIMPKRHLTHFEDLSQTLLDDFSKILKRTLQRIELGLNNPPYNYLIHTSPFDVTEVEYYHWHLEIIPRLTRVAGFEWGTGFYINPVIPEEAGKFLREVSI